MLSVGFEAVVSENVIHSELKAQFEKIGDSYVGGPVNLVKS